MSENSHKKPKRLFKQLCSKNTVCLTCILCLSLGIVLIYNDVASMPLYKNNNPISVYYMDYDVSRLDNSKGNLVIKYGHSIFQETPKYLGPNKKHPDRTYSGNGLSCKNCHLSSGTKPFAAPLIGIIQRFPQFRGHENKIGTIEERINGCMERSMNGTKMPEDIAELKALVAYLEWLGRYAPEKGKIEGHGFVDIDIRERAVDLTQGKTVFTKHCITCHGADGQGTKSEYRSTYTCPPLWGNDSYNDGTRTTRVITAAQFIKANMPFGTTYENPVLTDEEAYDVAGYINQQPRPTKRNSELDFPDLKKKPVSTPYPPIKILFQSNSTVWDRFNLLWIIIKKNLIWLKLNKAEH